MWLPNMQIMYALNSCGCNSFFFLFFTQRRFVVTLHPENKHTVISKCCDITNEFWISP